MEEGINHQFEWVGKGTFPALQQKFHSTGRRKYMATVIYFVSINLYHVFQNSFWKWILSLNRIDSHIYIKFGKMEVKHHQYWIVSTKDWSRCTQMWLPVDSPWWNGVTSPVIALLSCVAPFLQILDQLYTQINSKGHIFFLWNVHIGYTHQSNVWQSMSSRDLACA